MLGYALLWPKNCVLLAQECMLSMLKEFGKSMIIRLVNVCSLIFHFGHLSRRRWCISAKAEHKKSHSRWFSTFKFQNKILQNLTNHSEMIFFENIWRCLELFRFSWRSRGLVCQVCWSSYHDPDLILFGFLEKSPIMRSISDCNVQSWIWSVVTLVGEENPRLRYELSG